MKRVRIEITLSFTDKEVEELVKKINANMSEEKIKNIIASMKGEGCDLDNQSR